MSALDDMGSGVRERKTIICPFGEYFEVDSIMNGIDHKTYYAVPVLNVMWESITVSKREKSHRSVATVHTMCGGPTCLKW